MWLSSKLWMHYLGLVEIGDIGELFPDTSDLYKNISSTKLLEEIKELLISFGYIIGNIDITIIAQTQNLWSIREI